MSKHAYDALYWGVAWIGVGFFAAELLGYFGVAPWGTLTSTVRWSITYPLVGVFLMGVVIFLPAHLLFGRPVWQSLLFGLAVSVAAHLLDKQWP
jgi:hypothetical protein